MTELPERKRLRWREFDYSTAANYFITLVVNDRQCLLGDVKNGVLVHSEAGRMVEQVLLLQFFIVRVPLSCGVVVAVSGRLFIP